MSLCPDLSPPKPLDQSKYVTVRSYHKLSKDQNGPNKLPKSHQNGKKKTICPRRHDFIILTDNFVSFVTLRSKSHIFGNLIHITYSSENNFDKPQK